MVVGWLVGRRSSGRDCPAAAAAAAAIIVVVNNPPRMHFLFFFSSSLPILDLSYQNCHTTNSSSQVPIPIACLAHESHVPALQWRRLHHAACARSDDILTKEILIRPRDSEWVNETER